MLSDPKATKDMNLWIDLYSALVGVGSLQAIIYTIMIIKHYDDFINVFIRQNDDPYPG